MKSDSMKDLSFLFSPVILILLSLAPAEAVRSDDRSGQVTPDESIERYRAWSVAKWESDILKLEERDRGEIHPADAILFVGSSSIRRWDTIGDDMSPYHAIQRGFGGSRFSDLAVYADRLIAPHRFRAVVVFVANDIKGEGREDEPADKTPAEIARLFGYFRDRVAHHAPGVPVFCIAITPTEKRRHVWEQTRAANEAIRALCREREDTYFIGTESLYLDERGDPRADLFVDDRLHLNSESYRLWAAAIKSHLDSVLGEVISSQ